jgi:hypothetical protein
VPYEAAIAHPDLLNRPDIQPVGRHFTVHGVFRLGKRRGAFRPDFRSGDPQFRIGHGSRFLAQGIRLSAPGTGFLTVHGLLRRISPSYSSHSWDSETGMV